LNPSAPILLIIAAVAGFTTGAYLDGEVSPHSFRIPIQIMEYGDASNMSIFKSAEMSSQVQSIIDHAIIDFNIIQVPDGEFFKNVVDQCVFRSDQSFKPLCIKCIFHNGLGQIVATGDKIDLGSSYTANNPIPIEMFVPNPPTGGPIYPDVQDVKNVKISICGEVCVPVFADFTTLPHGSKLGPINNALAPSGIELSATANSGGDSTLVVFDGDIPSAPQDPDLQVGNGLHILIIPETGTLQDTNPADGFVDAPDDSANGGTIFVRMNTPFFLKSFVFVDHENNPAEARAYDAKFGGNLIKTVPIPLAGDKSIQTVVMNAANVQRLEVQYKDSGGITNIDLRCAPPTEEGCSIGFWKKHPEAWKTYQTTQQYATIFGLAAPQAALKITVDGNPISLSTATLLQALNAQGGQLNNLARQSVAALLNSAALSGSYPYSTAQVLSLTKAAIIAGGAQIDNLAKDFDTANNLGGPLCGGTSQGCPQDPTVTTEVLTNGDVKVTYKQSLNLNDNSYGVNAVGWGTKGHTFKDLKNSDNLQFQFIRNSDGKVVLDFISDYITATSGNTLTTPAGVIIQTPSRYASLGPFGGDGSMLTGTNTNIWVKEYRSSFADSLNNNGYFNNGVQTQATKSQADLLLNSPLTISSSSYMLPGNSLFTAWDFTNTYTVIISKDAFPDGFEGKYSVVFPSLHNSPAKKCPTTPSPTSPPTETSKVIFSTSFEDTSEKYNWKFDSSRSDASSSKTKLEILTTNNADPAKARTGTKYLGGSGDFDPKYAAYNRSIDVSAYHGVQISLWYSSEDTETDDDYALYYKDGSNWVPIKVVPSSELNTSSGQTSWKNVIASIPDSVDTLVIQFRGSTSSTSEHMMLDDLQVSGIPN